MENGLNNEVNNEVNNEQKNIEPINNKKKNKKLLYIICLVVSILLIALGCFFLFGNKKEEPATKEIPRLEDDFYENINASTSTSPFVTSQAATNQNLYELIDEIENDDNFTDENYKIFMGMYLNYDKNAQDGLSALTPYFEQIDNANTLDEFSDILVKVNYDLEVNSFINWQIFSDLYDNSKNVILINPMILENMDVFNLVEGQLPSGLEFFTNDKYSTYKNALENARIEFFELYGYDKDKATEISNQINEFAKKIQEKSFSIDEIQQNYTEYYKNLSKEELKALIKNLPIDKLLDKFEIGDYKYFAILDEGHLKALDEFYSIDNLPLMKEILKLAILENVASMYSTRDYQKIVFDTYLTLQGLKGNMQYYQALASFYYYNNLAPKLMGSYFNIKYDEKYFTEVEKLEIIELINKVKEHYIEVINSSDWLEDSTKEEAIKKITNLKVNVGYVQKEEFDSNLKLVDEENGGTLLSNYILICQDDARIVKEAINKKATVNINHFLANAYYNPVENSINFPSAFREIYRNLDNKYEIYAYAGMIIGHEISHAFDNNGSKYDENGNLKDWWTENDQKSFDLLKQKIVDYYSKYEYFGYKIDGANTLGENIADLAAVKTIISIMEEENATTEDFKKFFETYAKLWYTEASKATAEASILDTHSPNKIRVNAVLSSMDKFYETYNIKEEDKMFIPKEERVGLW